MSYIVPVLGAQILIQIGDGATPEVFAHSNVVNTTRGVTLSTEVEADDLVDLADQSAPAAKFRRVKSKDVKIDGAGMMSAGDTFEWIERWNSGKPFTVKVTDGNWLGIGKFILTNFQMSADRTKPGENQLTLEQAEPIVFTEVSPAP